MGFIRIYDPPETVSYMFVCLHCFEERVHSFYEILKGVPDTLKGKNYLEVNLVILLSLLYDKLLQNLTISYN